MMTTKFLSGFEERMRYETRLLRSGSFTKIVSKCEPISKTKKSKMARYSDTSLYHLFDRFRLLASGRRTSDRFSHRRPVMTNASDPLRSPQAGSAMTPQRAE